MNEKPYTTAGGDVARPAGSPGDSLLSDAKNAVGHMAEGAKEQVVTRVESQKDKAAEKIGNVAGALRAAGEPLADMGPLPDLAGRAADQIESIAEYVQSRTVGDMMHEVERFARREPAIFLGTAFGLGLLAGRFLKSSPRREIHPEIQDTDFEEQMAFGDGGYGVQGRFERRETYGSTGYGASGSTSGSTSGNTWGERSVERNNPGIDRTTSSGFGGYGGSYATGNSSAYDTTGSSVSAKPSTDLSSGNAFSRTESSTTKPMGTMGSSSVTSATPSTSSTAGSSSSMDAGGLKPIADSPLTVGSTTAPMPTASTTTASTAGSTANKAATGSTPPPANPATSTSTSGTSNGSTSGGTTGNGTQRSSGRP